MSAIVNVAQLKTGGSGTPGDPWIGWEAPLHDIASNREVYFEAGYYRQADGIDITNKVGWTVRGAGKSSTFIQSDHDGAGILGNWGSDAGLGQSQGPKAVNVTIADLCLQNFRPSSTTINPNNTKGGLDLYGGTYISLRRVQTQGFRFGLVLDACELVNVEECDFESAFVGCAYLANSNDYHSDSASGLTNGVFFRATQFNANAPTIGLIDDGGNEHHLVDCNFNGCGYHIIQAGINGLVMDGCELESAMEDCILYKTESFIKHQIIGQGTSQVYIGNTFSAAPKKRCIVFYGGGPTLIGNSFSSSVAPITGSETCFRFCALGNWTDWSGAPKVTDAYQGDLTDLGHDSGTGLYSHNYFTGINTLNPRTALDVNGALALRPNGNRRGVGVLANGLNRDVVLDEIAGSSFRGTSFLRITGPNQAFSVSGFAGGSAGRLLYVVNTTDCPMTIVDEGSTSIAASRIRTLRESDVTLRPGASAATFIYDDNMSRWILMGMN